MNRHSTYWFETAEDDIVTAQALFEAGRYLWMGYICQLVIEKALTDSRIFLYTFSKKYVMS